MSRRPSRWRACRHASDCGSAPERALASARSREHPPLSARSGRQQTRELAVTVRLGCCWSKLRPQFWHAFRASQSVPRSPRVCRQSVRQSYHVPAFTNWMHCPWFLKPKDFQPSFLQSCLDEGSTIVMEGSGKPTISDNQ